MTTVIASDSRLTAFLSTVFDTAGPGLHAITGPAGSGKTFASRIFGGRGDSVYSADFRFIGDSAERQALLDRKAERSITDYRDAANQYNWWDWYAIQRDLSELLRGVPVTLADAYDRSSGRKLGPRIINPARRVVFEGALLGPAQMVARLNRIVFLCTPAEVRFARILDKDRSRRSFNEILARFLVTEYSESIYYRQLFSWAFA